MPELAALLALFPASYVFLGRFSMPVTLTEQLLLMVLSVMGSLVFMTQWVALLSGEIVILGVFAILILYECLCGFLVVTERRISRFMLRR